MKLRTALLAVVVALAFMAGAASTWFMAWMVDDDAT